MKTLHCRTFAFFSLFIILIIFNPVGISSAQEMPPLTPEQLANPPAETENIKVTQVATVNIYDLTITNQEGRNISVSFLLSNREGVQPDISYAAHLIAVTNQEDVALDAAIFPANEKVTLRENDNQPKTMNFTVPDWVNAGEYIVEVRASNPSGINLARQIAGKVTLPTGSGGVVLRGNQCALRIAEETPSVNYSPFSGIDISENETLILDCQVINTSGKTVQVVPTFTTYRRNIASGVVIDTPNIPHHDPVILSPGKMEKISFLLPKATLPQAYDVSVVLGDPSGTQISDTVIVHYVIQGVSGAIQNLLLNKESYLAGDTATATVTFSRASDRFPGARGGEGTQIDSVNIELTLVDVNGQACSNPVTKLISKNDSAQQNLSFSVIKDCNEPTVNIKLVNAQDGTVLDTVSASLASSVKTTDNKPEIKPFTPQNESFFSSESLLILIIVIIAAVLLVLLGAKLSRSKGKVLGLLFIFAMSLSFMFGVGEVQADTIYTTTQAVPTAYGYVWDPLAYTGTISVMVCGWWDCWWEDQPQYGAWVFVVTAWGYINGTLDVNYTYSLNKSAYNPGETMSVSVYGYYWTCTNSSYTNVYAYVRPHQDSSFGLLADMGVSSLAEEDSVLPQRYTWSDRISSLWRTPRAEAMAYYGYMSVAQNFSVSAAWSTAAPYATFWFYSIVPKWAWAGGISNFYRNIPYTINVNGSPTIPSITGPVSGSSGVSYAFSFAATDPQGDPLRYGVDWDNNNTVDEWVPSSGYVPSGTSQSLSHAWPSGTYTFKVQAQDNLGKSSGWSSHTINIVPSTPSVSFSALGCTIPTGSSSCSGSITWNFISGTAPYSVKNITNSDVYGNTSSGTNVPAPINYGSYTITADDGGTLSDSAVINASCNISIDYWNSVTSKCVTRPVAPVIDIVADPNLVRSGDSAEINIDIHSLEDLSCTIYNAQTAPEVFTHTGSATPTTYNRTTRPLTAAQVVTVTCSVNSNPLITGEGKARISVVGIWEEQ